MPLWFLNGGVVISLNQDWERGRINIVSYNFTEEGWEAKRFQSGQLDIMTSYLIVSKDFLKSVLIQHLLGVFFLKNPYIIFSASMVLSEIFLPWMKVVWLGDMSSPNNFESLLSSSSKLSLSKIQWMLNCTFFTSYLDCS